MNRGYESSIGHRNSADLRLIRFRILTGCRRGEGGVLTRGMIDRTARMISLPPTFTKQGRGHIVPIGGFGHGAGAARGA